VESRLNAWLAGHGARDGDDSASIGGARCWGRQRWLESQRKTAAVWRHCFGEEVLVLGAALLAVSVAGIASAR
jgi:hypothetical protein